MYPLFQPGQSVRHSLRGLRISRGRGDYQIVKRLPYENGEHRYLIKSESEPHERVASESSLVPASDTPVSDHDLPSKSDLKTARDLDASRATQEYLAEQLAAAAKTERLRKLRFGETLFVPRLQGE
jgi:hypothetical protein